MSLSVLQVSVFWRVCCMSCHMAFGQHAIFTLCGVPVSDGMIKKVGGQTPAADVRA